MAQDAPSNDPVTHGDPFTPVGNLLVTPTVVQPGVHPEMFWNIDYPYAIPDLVVVDNAGGMTLLNDKSDRLTVRVAGVGEHTNRVAVWVRIDNGTWNMVFYGTEADVDAGAAVFTTTVQPGTRVDLAARGTDDVGGWGPVQWTLDSASTLDALIDGAPLPGTITTEPESFMSQYVGPNGELVAGPRDIVHVFEVETSDPASSDYDLQDVVVVSTYGRNNNGHGNNTDGVDMSNPGESDGTAGSTETDPYVDDEKSKILRK